MTTVALILVEGETRELRDVLADAAGRPHRLRFTARGFRHDDLPSQRSA